MLEHSPLEFHLEFPLPSVTEHNTAKQILDVQRQVIEWLNIQLQDVLGYTLSELDFSVHSGARPSASIRLGDEESHIILSRIQERLIGNPYAIAISATDPSQTFFWDEHKNASSK